MKKELLITGGTGSLGKAILKYISESKHDLKGIRIYSRDELKQYNLKKELAGKNLPPIAFIIGDVRDYRRMEEALKGVNLVIHAAALKHVPIAEENPLEYIQTNVYGTENVMRACIAAKSVEKAVFISTDKSVEPTTLYGASKLCGEKLWLRGSLYSGGWGTKFAAVRYGNVIGSRGSILDMISLLESGHKIPVTDPEMTRFWIPIPRVSGFVLNVLENMQEGCLYIPKMVSCKLSTFLKASTETDESSWEIIGKRAGEKIHEMLISQDEINRTLELEDRYVVYQNIQKHENVMGVSLFSDERNTNYIDDVEKIKILFYPDSKKF